MRAPTRTVPFCEFFVETLSAACGAALGRPYLHPLIDGCRAIAPQGDLVVLASGGAVPADCRINAGRIEVDQSGLTGESLPVAMVGPTGQPKMGSTVTRGEVEATVEVRPRERVSGADEPYGDPPWDVFARRLAR